MDKKTNAGHITALITIVIWGTTFISTKILLADFTPIEILFFRFLLGLLALAVVYPERLRIKDKKQELTQKGGSLQKRQNFMRGEFCPFNVVGFLVYWMKENRI